MTFSSNDIFNFHPKKITCGAIKKVRVSVKASPAEGRRRFPSHKHGLCPAFRVQQAFMWSNRRPKAGDASPEGLLKVERRVFRCLGV